MDFEVPNFEMQLTNKKFASHKFCWDLKTRKTFVIAHFLKDCC